MSVIVKGMEMPKYCYDCPMQDGETGICNILKITVYDIPKECPLVEVIECKDCKHWEWDVIFKGGWCRGRQQGNPDWFCADGKRGEER